MDKLLRFYDILQALLSFLLSFIGDKKYAPKKDEQVPEQEGVQEEHRDSKS